MIKFSSLCFLGFLLTTTSYAENLGPAVQNAVFSKTYIAMGFDSNDHIQIVGEGTFANTCYRPAPTTWKLDAQNTIVLEPKAYFYDGFCLQVMVPYNQVLDLGILKAGTYNIKAANSEQAFGQITIKEATVKTADDFVYAPITQAYYKKVGARHMVYLTGEFTNNCMKFKNAKIDVQSSVIVVQPISEMTSDIGCTKGSFPFEKGIEIKNATTGRYLLHVRSLNGKAVNTLIDIM